MTSNDPAGTALSNTTPAQIPLGNLSTRMQALDQKMDQMIIMLQAAMNRPGFPSQEPPPAYAMPFPTHVQSGSALEGARVAPPRASTADPDTQSARRMGLARTNIHNAGSVKGLTAPLPIPQAVGGGGPLVITPAGLHPPSSDPDPPTTLLAMNDADPPMDFRPPGNESDDDDSENDSSDDSETDESSDSNSEDDSCALHA